MRLSRLRLEAYTSDAYVHALKASSSRSSQSWCFSRIRIRCATSRRGWRWRSTATVIPDSIGYKYEGGKLLFTRQMFQGKFAADVSFAGDRSVARDHPDRGVPERSG